MAQGQGVKKGKSSKFVLPSKAGSSSKGNKSGGAKKGGKNYCYNIYYNVPLFLSLLINKMRLVKKPKGNKEGNKIKKVIYY